MKLHVGDRLPGFGPPGQPGGYVVTAVKRESPWMNLYAGKKILYNFDFANDRCRESDQGEWLDVLLRTCAYGGADTPEKAESRRAAARQEVRTILAGRTSNYWPDPVDLLLVGGPKDEAEPDVEGESEGESEAEAEAESDEAGEGRSSTGRGTQAGSSEPVAVFELRHGKNLTGWLAGNRPLADRLVLVAELLTLIESAHRESLLLNGLGPDAVVIDGDGRVSYMATDCVVDLSCPAAQSWRAPWLYPPERYCLGFSAPECFDAEARPDFRADLFAWGTVAFYTLTGIDPADLAARADERSMVWQPEDILALSQALATLPGAYHDSIPEALQGGWPDHLVRVIERCLAPNSAWRPASIGELRLWLLDPPSPAPQPKARSARRARVTDLPGPTEEQAACPVCHHVLARSQLEKHVRLEHRIFAFRGHTAPLEETLDALLDAVCARHADTGAWQQLETIAAEEYGDGAEAYLASRLTQKLQRVSGETRFYVAAAIGEAVAAGDRPRAYRLATALASQPESDREVESILLAMEITGHLPAPLDSALGFVLASAVRARLGVRRTPSHARLRAAAQLLRSTGGDKAQADAILQALLGGYSKAKALRRLQKLEELAGGLPEIEQFRNAIQDQMRMSCPRCAAELRRVEMVKHLWDEHRLVLDGKRVREPWRVIEDWLEDYRVEGYAEILQRCWSLARRMDPAGGPPRLQRLMLQHGIEDIQARNQLLAQARQQRSSLCPHCFALVPLPPRPAWLRLDGDHDLLEGGGYRVEVFDGGIVPRLEIETPAGPVFDDREPGRRLTRSGACLLLGGPLLLLTALLLFVPVELPIANGLLAALSGGIALVVFGMIFLAGDASQGPLERVIDHAWQELVPRLLARRPTAQDLDFIAALAQLSPGQGDAAGREPVVDDTRKSLEDAVAANRAPAEYLGAVWHLAIEDYDPKLQDVAMLQADQVARSLEGNLPLGFVTELLAQLDDAPITVAAHRRLQILICRRAYRAGLEVPDLRDLATANKALAKVIEPKNLDYLAHLKLLHELQGSNPWSRLGGATSILELVDRRQAALELLDKVPDLMLKVEMEQPLYLCAGGVIFRDTWIYEMPQVIDVIARSFYEEGGFNLTIGSRIFWFEMDPMVLATELEKWLSFYFKELCPQLTALYERPRSPRMHQLLAKNGTRCRECRRRVIPVESSVGITDFAPRREEIPMVLPAVE
jgi:hypothetical protein